jgi:hypothetical protein
LGNIADGMQRLIEQPADTGDLFEAGVRLGRAHYHLAVYQHFAESEDETVPENIEVEGRIVPLDGLDLTALQLRRSELVLRLADGRSLDFSVTDETGRIHSTGRGLYRS